jgi:hypothetical protein
MQWILVKRDGLARMLSTWAGLQCLLIIITVADVPIPNLKPAQLPTDCGNMETCLIALCSSRLVFYMFARQSCKYCTHEFRVRVGIITLCVIAAHVLSLAAQFVDVVVCRYVA